MIAYRDFFVKSKQEQDLQDLQDGQDYAGLTGEEGFSHARLS